ncbi:hypothetical protein BU15DRAFT_66270 [Melanogaster broomeanus]|nr:hypothetical protein BU15DRAFT_66270 [Melanogaster broomeanus]
MTQHSQPIHGLKNFFRVGNDFLVAHPNNMNDLHFITRVQLRAIMMLDYSSKLRTLHPYQFPKNPLGYEFVCRAYNDDPGARGEFLMLDLGGHLITSVKPEPDSTIFFGDTPDDILMNANEVSEMNQMVRLMAQKAVRVQTAINQRQANHGRARPYIKPGGYPGSSSAGAEGGGRTKKNRKSKERDREAVEVVKDAADDAAKTKKKKDSIAGGSDVRMMEV